MVNRQKHFGNFFRKTTDPLWSGEQGRGFGDGGGGFERKAYRNLPEIVP